MSHEMGIEDNQDTLISEMHKGVKRGEEPLLQNITRKNVVVVVFCYNYAERYIIKEKEIHYRGNRNTSDRENEKTERKYTIGETRT